MRCRGRIGVAVGVRPANRLTWPPEVEVVLVVPAVDRGVCAGQIQHREQERAVSEIDAVAGSSTRSRATSLHNTAGPPALCQQMALCVWSECAGRRGPHDAVAAEGLDLVEVRRVRVAGERVRAGGTELRGALQQERLDPADPGRGVEDRHLAWRPTVAASNRPRCDGPTAMGRSVRHPAVRSSSLRPLSARVDPVGLGLAVRDWRERSGVRTVD